MSYNMEPLSADCYEGTTCLINKLDIRDEKELSAIETAISLANISLLEQEPLKGNFDFSHYKAIHSFIFDELYDWGGKIRTVNLSKGGTQFVPANEIERVGNAIFSRLTDTECFHEDTYKAFVNHISELYCDINLLHPFREGNGRAQRAFIAQLVRYNGYNIDFGDIDMDYLMVATIQAANGVTDHINKIFSNAIKNK